jgi:hypothetical protein
MGLLLEKSTRSTKRVYMVIVVCSPLLKQSPENIPFSKAFATKFGWPYSFRSPLQLSGTTPILKKIKKCKVLGSLGALNLDLGCIYLRKEKREAK